MGQNYATWDEMPQIEIFISETSLLVLSEAKFMPKPKKQTRVVKPKSKPAPKTVDNPKKTSPVKFPGKTW